MYAEQIRKKCSRCKVVKPLEDFNNSKSKPDGKHNNCRECCKKEYRNNRHKYLEKRKLYREKNKESVSIRKNRAGATEEQFRSLFQEQRGRCAICETHQNDMKRRISVDHNHDTGQIRGLLCDNCNRCLGLLKDDVKVLEKAIIYLKKYLK